MAEVVVMPKLGFNMDEGHLVKWIKNEGDEISKGSPLFEIQTDKTNIEIEATTDGILRKIIVKEGSTVPVTVPIAVIGTADESIDHLLDVDEVADSQETAVEDKPQKEIVKSNNSDMYDLAVIGAGPGGYVAAIKAAQKGLRVCVVEKQYYGGVCLNEGCIPTKAMVKSVKVLETVKKAAKYGVVGLEGVSPNMDMKAMQARKEGVVKQLTGGVEYLLKANGVELIKGAAEFVDNQTLDVDGKTVKAEKIMIATGSTPMKPRFEVDQDASLMTSREALELDTVPEHIVIIGGGVIGIEFAYILACVGAKVTVVELMDRILPMVDKEVTQEVSFMLKEIGVNILTDSKVSRVMKSSVSYESQGVLNEVECSHVLVATGRVPSTDGLGLENVSVKTERGAIITNEYLQTNVPNIYAIGDVNGKSMLAHTASMEGIVAVDHICGGTTKMDYRVIPSCIYTLPEVACVGLTEEEARKQYKEVQVGRFSFTGNGKAVVEGADRGIAKVIVEPRLGEILGIHVFGDQATNLIGEIVLAMQAEISAEEVVQTIHAHPTLSEVLPEALLDAIDKPIHSH